MPNNVEQRLYRLEHDVQAIRKLLDQILARLAKLEQQQYVPGGQGGGGSDAFFVAFPTAAVAGATWGGGGSIPTASVSFTAHVYRVSRASGTDTITDLGVQPCANWLAAGLVAGHGVVVKPDSQGTYGVVSQSCA